jgi:hypothetical protein
MDATYPLTAHADKNIILTGSNHVLALNPGIPEPFLPTKIISSWGIEFAYNIEGKSEFKLDGKSFIIEAGDSISFDARYEHSVTALEPLNFFGIFIGEN